MTNNDILRRLRYTFDLSDSEMLRLLALGGCVITRAVVSDWLKKDDDPAFQPCEDAVLAAFLNGLIVDRRGSRDGQAPVAESRLSNNEILRKLKIALSLRDTDLLELLALAGFPIGKPELSALFRHPTHPNYRPCQDQLLRNFLRGMQVKYRVAAGGNGDPADD